jgi:hypothetical protein
MKARSPNQTNKLKTEELLAGIESFVQSFQPTTEQLATLAAALARNTNSTPKQLVEKAWRIWIAAWSKGFEEFAARKGGDAGDLAKRIVRPKKFPITHEAMVALLVPKLKGRTGDAAEALKAYCAAYLRRETNSEPTQDAVDASYAMTRKQPIPEGEYSLYAMMFLRWFDPWHKARTSEARRNAGKQGGRPRKNQLQK